MADQQARHPQRPRICARSGEPGRGPRPDFTSDQLQGYAYAIPGAFGERADYAQAHKKFQNVKVSGPEWMKYRVNPLVGVDRMAIQGSPDLKTSTVCHMERFFLTMRQGNKRCARKTLAYSKSWENHALTSSIHIFVYNLVRRHETTKTTPAIALGVADKRWTLEDVVDMADAYHAAKEAAAFETAFAKPSFRIQPKPKRTYKPTPKSQLLTPWYMDKDSGGPNPPFKKPGVAYDLSQPEGDADSEKGMTD